MNLTVESQKKIKDYLDFLRQLLVDHGHNPDDASKLSAQKLIDCFRFCACCNEQLFTLEEQMWAVLEFDAPDRAFKVLADSLTVLPHLPTKPIQAEHVETDLDAPDITDPNIVIIHDEIRDNMSQECNEDEEKIDEDQFYEILTKAGFSFPEDDDDDEECEEECEEECDDESSCEDSCFVCDDDEEEHDIEVCTLCEAELFSEEDMENTMCPDCFEKIMAPEEETEAITTVVRGRNILEGAPTLDQAIERVADFLDHLNSLKAQGFELSEPVQNDYGYLEQIND